MRKSIKNSLIVFVFLFGCKSQQLLFNENDSIIKHKGGYIKENVIEYAVNEISSIEYCEEFSERVLVKMPNLKYRIVNPEVNVDVISSSYRLLGYIIKDKVYELTSCDCERIKILSKKGTSRLYGTSKLPKFIGSFYDSLNLNSEYKMEKKIYGKEISSRYYPDKEIEKIRFNSAIDTAYVKVSTVYLTTKTNLYVYDKYKEEWRLNKKNIKLK